MRFRGWLLLSLNNELCLLLFYYGLLELKGIRVGETWAEVVEADISIVYALS